MVSFDDINYLTSEDLLIPRIEDIPRIYGANFSSSNWETYALYLQIRGDKMKDEEKEFYLNIIREIKKDENVYIQSYLKKLKNSSSNVDNGHNNGQPSN